ncbi:MAG TPA: hypothetical protein VKN76_11760 [Kiloniellaceae bacterium]|nr:hypothetical protein [Kiloniellaceae bacterium]
MKTFLIIVFVCLVLALSGGYALFYALDLDRIEMSVHGYLAMGLGIGLSILLGGGLMALVFHSSRRGHDDTTFQDENKD